MDAPQLNIYILQPVLLDEKGSEIEGGDANGALCLKTPWPGIARTVYGDHRRFVETYFAPYPGYYFTGDGGHRDSEGYFQGSESVSLPLSSDRNTENGKGYGY